MLQCLVKWCGNVCVWRKIWYCKIQSEPEYSLSTSGRRGTVVRVSSYWQWCVLLLWISNLSISSLFMLQFGHVRKNVCGCQVSRFRVYNLLVTCQVKVCAKFSFSCDEEVIEEDALRTSLAFPPSTAIGTWQLPCALKRKFSKALRAKFLQKSLRFPLSIWCCPSSKLK